MDELNEAIPVSPPTAPRPENFFSVYSPPQENGTDSVYGDIYDTTLSPSNLNRRQVMGSELAAGSALNRRYMKNAAPSVPTHQQNGALPRPQGGAVENGHRLVPHDVPIHVDIPHSPPMTSPPTSSPHQQPPHPALLAESRMNQRYQNPSQITGGEQNLAQSKLNSRYTSKAPVKANGHVANGNIPNGQASPSNRQGLSDNRLNKRYNRPAVTGHSSKDQILRKQRQSEFGDGISHHSGQTGPSDMDRWLDNVFDPVLVENLDDLSDTRSLHKHIKGGGQTVSGIQTQVGNYFLLFISVLILIFNDDYGTQPQVNLLICLLVSNTSCV